jgi:hypothetical protein
MADGGRCRSPGHPRPARPADPWNDCATLRPLVLEAQRQVPGGCVLANAEFDSERNHLFCRELLRANSVIPTTRFTSRRAQMRQNHRHSVPPGALVPGDFASSRIRREKDIQLDERGAPVDAFACD